MHNISQLKKKVYLNESEKESELSLKRERTKTEPNILSEMVNAKM